MGTMRSENVRHDITVVGGGLAGTCAAIAAARLGASVALVTNRPVLGGNSSSEVKMHVVGANNHTGRPGWREGGIIEELRLDDAVNNPQRCWEMWDLLHALGVQEAQGYFIARPLPAAAVPLVFPTCCAMSLSGFGHHLRRAFSLERLRYGIVTAVKSSGVFFYAVALR